MELPIRHRLPRTILVLFIALAVTRWMWANPGAERVETPRAQLTMFMPNRGVAHHVGCDPSDNWAINIVEKYANVDLLLDIPNWSDYTTKVNLLLASANLPNIVNGNVSAEFITAAEAGAFLDLKPYYDRSARVRKACPPLNFELARGASKMHWAIAMSTTGQEGGRGVILRYDLLNWYNGSDLRLVGGVDEQLAADLIAGLAVRCQPLHFGDEQPVARGPGPGPARRRA